MQNRNPKKLNRGSAMLLSLIVLMLVFGLGISVLMISQAGTRVTQHRKSSLQALNLADSALTLAVYRLRLNPNYVGQTNTALGPGTISVTVTKPAGQSTIRIVSATGHVDLAEGMASERTVVGTISLSPKPPMMGFGVLSKGDVGLSGGVVVDSSPIVGVGNVGSNGDISMSGSTSIDGNATAGGTYKSSGGASVSGAITQKAAPVDFPG